MARRKKSVTGENLPEGWDISDTVDETVDSTSDGDVSDDTELKLEVLGELEVVEERLKVTEVSEIFEIEAPVNESPELEPEVSIEVFKIDSPQKSSGRTEPKESKPVKPKAKRKPPKNKLKFVR